MVERESQRTLSLLPYPSLRLLGLLYKDQYIRTVKRIVKMSWSHSLRSPSLSPPPQDAALPPVQLEHDNAGTSLWDNEGDRNDPIDIANVWEPGIKFKETPFTIAKRNGMRKESNYQDKQGTGKVS